MTGYKIFIQSEIRAQNCFHSKVCEQDFCFLVTVLELTYLLYGIAKGLRYLLYIGVQDQDLSFAILRAVQFNFEVRRFLAIFSQDILSLELLVWNKKNPIKFMKNR